MPKHRVCSASALSGALATVLSIAAGGACAAQRTFVASYGVDTNACSLIQPCRTFTQALTLTASGGEIIALDSAGYGPVTIGQSVSIIAAPGVYAGITASGGLNGIDVTGGTTVVLRGLSIGSLGSGVIGVNAYDAKVSVEDCTISGFQTSGILSGGASGQLFVRDTSIRGNDYGIWISTSGSTATVHRANFHGHYTAVALSNGAVASISDSVFEDNLVGASVQAADSVTTTKLTISTSVMFGAPTSAGITAAATLGGTVWLQASGNRISRVGNGIDIRSDLSASAFASISGNAISNNSGNGIILQGANTHATIVGNTVSNHATWGILVLHGASASISNNAISGNVEGIYAADSGTTVTVGGNVVADNGPGAGFRNDAPASFMTRGDNTLTANSGGGQTFGPITPIGGF